MKLIKFRNYFGKRWNAIKLLFHEYTILVNHLGSSGRINNFEKERAYVLIELHTIEKGLSLKDVRIGFGQPKVEHVLDLTLNFVDEFKDYSLITYVLKPIQEYILFHEENNYKLNDGIYKKYNQLLKLKGKTDLDYYGGTRKISKDEILINSKIDFENFSNFRFSIRNFSGNQVSEEIINKAFKIAQKAPSPCNRQPWKNYVTSNKELIDKIISLQQGGRQFKGDLSQIIVVTSSYKYFFGSEHHQTFVSGGMYAMTLIYALHSMGAGTISLNLGIEQSRLDSIYKILNISNDLAPIIIIGVGDINDELQVAYAERFDYKEYTEFI